MSKNQKSETCSKDSKFVRKRNPEEKKLMFLTSKVLEVIKVAGVISGEIVAKKIHNLCDSRNIIITRRSV